MSIYLTAMKNYLGQQKTTESFKPKALILIAGATGGAEEGFLALERIKTTYDLMVVASQNAFNLYGEENLKSLTGVSLIHNGEEFKNYDFLKTISLVFLPVITANLVGKLAHGIYDEPLASIIFHAKLAGKPVLGIVDGALPDGEGFKRRGFNNPPAGLVKLIQENIEKVREQEIFLYEGKKILAKLSPYLALPNPEIPKETSFTRIKIKKRIVTRDDLLNLKEVEVIVPQKAILTDLAREYAAQKKIKITYGE
ncbi:flavoprotein [Carboxydothermus pertinax]|uniref:Flavoprotein domain-containing protein n=1 Tax=Carboxydothermus pertinax TaxID=870242 RepID=A0A1L8CSN3_9THEO|nr:flavoprotein [Carboxydothermus pertinax]GAV21922.1 hypothetical protein cpu_04320 [Carboxydothermus pertinax]